MFEEVAPSAGSQNAERLTEDRTDVLDRAQHKRDDHRIESLVLER